MRTLFTYLLALALLFLPITAPAAAIDAAPGTFENPHPAGTKNPPLGSFIHAKNGDTLLVTAGASVPIRAYQPPADFAAAQGQLVYHDGAAYILSGEAPIPPDAVPGGEPAAHAFYPYNPCMPTKTPWLHAPGSFENPLPFTEIAALFQNNKPPAPGTFCYMEAGSGLENHATYAAVHVKPGYNGITGLSVAPFEALTSQIIPDFQKNHPGEDVLRYLKGMIIHHKGSLYVLSGKSIKGITPGSEKTPTAFYPFDPERPTTSPWEPVGSARNPYTWQEAEAYHAQHGHYPVGRFATKTHDYWGKLDVLTPGNPLDLVVFTATGTGGEPFIPVRDFWQILDSTRQHANAFPWADFKGTVVLSTRNAYAPPRLFILSGETPAYPEGQRHPMDYTPYPEDYTDINGAYYDFLPHSPQYTPWEYPVGSFENPIPYERFTSMFYPDGGLPPAPGTHYIGMTDQWALLPYPFVFTQEDADLSGEIFALVTPSSSTMVIPYGAYGDGSLPDVDVLNGYQNVVLHRDVFWVEGD